MAGTKKKITIRNIFWFLQGNARYKLVNSPFKFLVAPYIRRQIKVREASAHEICQTLGACKECGCSIPQLQYADGECHAWCYPQMLNKEQFTELERGGQVDDLLLGITWKITNGKYHYQSIPRDNKREA